MQTVKIRVNEKSHDELMSFLSKFNKSEVEIISEFLEVKNYLNAELNEILNGQAIFIDIDEAETRLESIIEKHEDSI
ncbi:MAG TPA: hypothetical protein VLZ75_08840 [Chitinophagales bacterium]|nr:hypothetical protein [Chitinophagales bacterium]